MLASSIEISPPREPFEVLEEYLQKTQAAPAVVEEVRAHFFSAPDILVGLIEEFKPSLNALRGLLQLASEVARRDSCSLEEVLNKVEFQALTEAVGMSRKDKLKHLRQRLQRIRFPHRAALEERIQLCQREIFNRSGLQIEVPEELEGDSIRVTISARNPQEFMEISQKLAQLSQEEACVEIFSILLGEW